ncbi:alpha/beta hydrolase [Streptomyces capparidis]
MPPWYWLRALARETPPPGRAALAVFVVLVMLATSGWTANRHANRSHGPRAAAVEAWKRGTVDHRRLPRPDAPPPTVARFFASLGERQQERLAARHPLVVGNLDGVPLPLRYRANRLSLNRAIAAELRRRRTAQLTSSGRRQSRQLVNRYRSLLSPDRRILAFDPTGRGTAAEVLGDLSTAERVAVLVPGAGVDLLSFERTRRSREAPAGMARALYASLRQRAPQRRVAVVAWAGYTTPDGLDVDAARGTLAERGAALLRRMVAALPGRARVSLFCHSYGSVVCGVAAPGLPRGRVADIAVFGSPGIRADRAADLGTDARVWAARDPDDWIADVPNLEFAGFGHGTDPVSREFGARVLSAHDARGHTGYLEPGTASLRNFTRVALGEYGAVSCAGTDPACTADLAATA